MYFRKIREFNGWPDTQMSESQLDEVRTSLKNGDIWVLRNAFDPNALRAIREYLTDIGRHSLPNYHPLTPNTPNFHRIVGPDPRTYVEGRFHQWSFFPWNEDPFDFFDFFRPAYELNNSINGWPAESYLGIEPERGCIARVAFQAYARGIGYINRHQDAAGPHKFTTMTLALSTKGDDYDQGGTYVGTGDNQPDFDLDGVLKIGDVTFMHSKIVHGVAPIDPDTKGNNWLTFDGKWSCVLAVNKVTDTVTVPDSIDLGSK